MTKDRLILPWGPYSMDDTTISMENRSLVSVFGELVAFQAEFAPWELPDIFAAAHDEGENDACKRIVSMQAELLASQFAKGTIRTFARQFGGGSATLMPAEQWEIDDPLPRFATGVFSLDQWNNPSAEPTHRIFVNAAEFDAWLAKLSPPGELNQADLDVLADPQLRAKRSVAAQKKRRTRKSAPESDQPNGDTRSSETQASLLLTMTEVRQLTRLGRNTIYTMMERGEFPKPIRRGRSVRWLKSKIEAWVAKLAAEQGVDQ